MWTASGSLGDIASPVALIQPGEGRVRIPEPGVEETLTQGMTSRLRFVAESSSGPILTRLT